MIYENTVGNLKKEVYAKDGLIYIHCDADTEKAVVNLTFICGRDDEETELYAFMLQKCLSKSKWTGLNSLIRRTEQDDENGYQLKDDEWYSTEGYFSSTINVENGRIVYSFEMNAVGCEGNCRFDCGRATLSRMKKVGKTIRNFEDTVLMPISYEVKHKYIDNCGYEEDFA